MQTPLRQLLSQYREHSQTEREKGIYFERLAIVFMQRDPGMVQEYEECWDFATWARLRGLPAGDTGIDAVAKIRGEDSFCAIQCKFYREGGSIAKSELDKFLATMGASRHFSRGMIIETTGRAISHNATALFDDLNVTVLGLDRLEESSTPRASPYWTMRETRSLPANTGSMLYVMRRRAAGSPARSI